MLRKSTSLNPRSSVRFSRWALNSSSHAHQAGHWCVSRIPPNVYDVHVTSAEPGRSAASHYARTAVPRSRGSVTQACPSTPTNGRPSGHIDGPFVDSRIHSRARHRPSPPSRDAVVDCAEERFVTTSANSPSTASAIISLRAPFTRAASATFEPHSSPHRSFRFRC